MTQPQQKIPSSFENSDAFGFMPLFLEFFLKTTLAPAPNKKPKDVIKGI